MLFVHYNMKIYILVCIVMGNLATEGRRGSMSTTKQKKWKGGR